jgi:hypothetical protein
MSDTEKQRRAADIGDEALRLDDPTEREEFIQAQCAGDNVLIQFVLEYVAGAPSDEPFARYLGTHIGPWTLTYALGAGGFGIVFLGERSKPSQRAAIKLLQGTVPSRDTEIRFRYEQQALAKLNHPFIVHLLDAGITLEGQAYVVMEYVDGAKPIDVYCQEKALTTRQKLELFEKICDAVSYAHRNEVVHRDLKPSNILVASDGTPKLVDFGLAKLMNPAEREGDLSRTGVMGSGRYMSPEQAKQADTNTTTDVYSLGVVLYELLTGTDPYNFERYTRTPLPTVIAEITPELASIAIRRATENTSDIRRLHRELSGDIDTILQMALRKEPERRYQYVHQFKEDLRKHLHFEPVTARPDSVSYRMGRFARRNRARLSGVGIGLGVAALIVAASYVGLLPRQYRYVIAGPDGPRSPYTVDDYIIVRLNNKPMGYADGKFTGCGPPKSPGICPESSAISFLAFPGSQLEVVAMDVGGGYVLTELDLYKESRKVMKLTDPIINPPDGPCAPIPCSFTAWRKEPASFFGRTVTLP